MSKPRLPLTEIAVTDGTRHVGLIIPRAGGFEAFDAAGAYLAKFDSQQAARAALIRADRESVQ